MYSFFLVVLRAGAWPPLLQRGYLLQRGTVMHLRRKFRNFIVEKLSTRRNYFHSLSRDAIAIVDLEFRETRIEIICLEFNYLQIAR